MNKSTVFKRSISALLCMAMAVSLCCAFAGMAEAKTSLPAVEDIKTSDEVFSILEIVPDAAQGSIGYYIDGQEPWVILAGQKTSSGLRKSFIEEELQGYLNKSSKNNNNSEYNFSLALCDPDGSNDSATSSAGYPLQYVGGYEEVYPWVYATAPDTTYKNYKQMPLRNAEKGTATGKMSYVGLGYGDYTIGDYEYVGESGDCLQLVMEFRTEQGSGVDGYWYNAAFKELTYKEKEELEGTVIDPSSEAEKWTIIYEEAGEGDDNYITVSIGTDVKNLKKVGVVGDRDFPGLDVSKTYYKATWGRPYTTKSQAQEAAVTGEITLFADISGGFRDKEADETGYFSKISYEYVGGGNGAYALTPSTGGTEYKVSTKIVYYTGGFKNNNWFLKYVMDYEDDELSDPNLKKPDIHVNTVAASAVGEKQCEAADMIVLNYGLNIQGETFSSIYKNDFGSANDLPSALVGKISTAGKPVIFDYNLKNLASNQGSNVKSTADALLNKALEKRSTSGFSTSAHHTFVGGNIYCIDGTGWVEGSGDGTVYHPALPLATSGFNMASAIVGDNLLKDGPFYPVYEEIYYENFLREVRGESGDNWLSPKLTMASVIRYIINYANTRRIDPKTEIRVLDIEPRTGRISDGQKEELAGWLNISPDKLFVTTMSSSEFIGSQADISEDYDLLYIGDSDIGFNTDSASFRKGGFFSGETYYFDYITYNDHTMTYNGSSSESGINKDTVSEYINNRQRAGWFFNISASDVVFGMRYTAIGDKVTSGKSYQLSGLLDRDYNSNSTINKSGNTNLFRYSGNDLTDAASQKIRAFANSGYPVIFADTLLQPPETDDSTLKDAEAKVLSTYRATPNINVSDSILKVTLDPSKGVGLFWLINSATCQLYKNGEPAQDEDGNSAIQTISPFRSVSFNLSDYNYKMGDEFYCTVKITSVRSIANWFYPMPPNPSTEGKTATVTIRGMAEPMFVDNSSVMYETINSIVGKENVTNWSSLNSEVTDIKQSLLARFANLSKPEIEFWNDSRPTSYEMKDGVMNSLTDDDHDGVYELKYVFKIKNNSDPYPTKTRYRVCLYLDLNGNGLFGDDELVNDVGLRNWTVYGSYGTPGIRAANGELVGSYGDKPDDQHYYYLSYEIPSSMVGIIPWKLKVEDVNYFGGHDSVIDYSRVAPTDEPDVLQILQIDSITTDSHFSLQDNIASNGTYKGLLKAVDSDFKVNIATIKSNFDTNWADNTTSYTTASKNEDGHTITTDVTIKVSYNSADRKYIKTISKSVGGAPAVTETEEYTSIADFLKSYDMLIIGFGDAYKNLSLGMTKALADYIKADKPVLMTHDTLSFCSYNGSGAYNYYPNMLLRDLIGVDRYGVTSLKPLSNGQSIGITQHADSSLQTHIKSLPGFSGWSGGFVPSSTYYSGGAKIDEARKVVLDGISKAGYSIAWKADKGRTQTVSETQGLTNAVLFRFIDVGIFDWLTGRNVDSYTISYKNSDKSRLGLTTKATQVNKGQINTYPYDINTAAFGGTGAELGIAKTHAQNYQLNMNSDEMIVWYCLAEDTAYGSGIYQKNDVTNAYYVYTCGNVTYTGSGHTTDSVNENEAKLFVNTMIAAYRVDRSGSTVSFSNDDGTVKGIEDFFVPTDGGTVLSVNDGKYSDSARNIYFTVNDSNLDDGKHMYATLSYKGFVLPISIYDADNNDEIYKYIDGEGKFVGLHKTLVSTYTYYVKLDDVIRAIMEINKKDSDTENDDCVTVDDLNKNLQITLSTIYSSGSDTPTTSTASLKLRQYRLFDLS